MDKKNNHHQIEVGDWHDTCSAITIAQGHIKTGNFKTGISLFCEIRDYIDQSNENQSLRHLLPGLDAAIASAKIARAKELEKARDLVKSEEQEGKWGRLDAGLNNG